MTADSETTEQCLNFVRTRFLISVQVFVSRDYEPQSRTGLIFQFANAFAIAITFARWWRPSEESTAVPYGTNFYILLWTVKLLVHIIEIRLVTKIHYSH